MSKAIEVITSVERRRRWSTAEKERLVAASLETGASVSVVAREAGFSRANCMDGDGSCFEDRRRRRALQPCGLRQSRHRLACRPLA